MLGTLPNLAHGIAELRLNAVQRGLDRHKISHVFLPGGSGQISGGNGIQYIGDLADVGPETVDCPLENKCQAADLIIGVNGDAVLSAAAQAQVALLQAAGHLGDLSQRSGDRLFQIRCQEKDARDNDANAHQRGPDYRHKNLVVGLRRGNSGEDQAVDHSGGVSSGNIGAQVLLIQNGCPAHIALPLLQHNLR